MKGRIAVGVLLLVTCVVGLGAVERIENERAEQCWARALAPARTWSDTLRVIEVVALTGYRACR